MNLGGARCFLRRVDLWPVEGLNIYFVSGVSSELVRGSNGFNRLTPGNG